VMVGFVVTLALIDYFGAPLEEKRLAQGATELLRTQERHPGDARQWVSRLPVTIGSKLGPRSSCVRGGRSLSA